MVGVDVGGTFTDAIAVAEDGSLRTAKVASTPADPSAGFEQALCELSAAGWRPARCGCSVTAPPSPRTR